MDDHIHPMNEIVRSNGSWYRYLLVKTHQLHRRRAGEHLVSRTACGAKPEGFVMMTSEAEGETSPSYEGERYRILPPVQIKNLFCHFDAGLRKRKV